MRIKIISNPYDGSVECFEGTANGWVSVEQLCPFSELLRESYTKGFLPFTAYDLLNQILSDYGGEGEVIEVIFEGCDDEFDELSQILEDDEMRGRMTLVRGERTLANARDMLPQVVSSFEAVRDIVEKMNDEEVGRWLAKLDEAQCDEVPLCVFGNYSSGKSTFINALIGLELMPSGANPVTSRVYRISNSGDSDRGCISFDVDEERVLLEFDANGLSNTEVFETPGLPDSLRQLFEASDESTLATYMRNTLAVLNATNSTRNISNRIDVEVPFSSADTWYVGNDFVIFDTPGSNAAYRQNDAEVLESAMRKFSNGLPIYLCTYNTMSDTANRDLCEQINKVKALDERFTIVVVNKADTEAPPLSGFTAEDRHELRNTPIPVELGTKGIYFASSILALGEKLSGSFASLDDTERYERNKDPFLNPQNRFYRELYRYNVLPDQIYRRSVEESATCPNRLLANSGVYCIEREIVRFAKRYATYNKCAQVRRYLDKIIERTEVICAEAKVQANEDVQQLTEDLERRRRALLAKLDNKRRWVSESEKSNYDSYLDVELQRQLVDDTLSWLRKREMSITAEHRRSMNYDEMSVKVETARDDVLRNFSSRLGRVLERPGLDTLDKAFSGLISDFQSAQDSSSELAKIKKEADENAADDIMRLVNERYAKTARGVKTKNEHISREFWIDAEDRTREALTSCATSDTLLSEERKKEIEDIIVRFEPLVLKDASLERFQKPEFINHPIFPFAPSERLNLDALASAFDEAVSDLAMNVRVEISQSHSESYENWLGRLYRTIYENICDYNPDLRDYSEKISYNEQRIAELTDDLERLGRCSREVKVLLDWNE